MVYFFKASELVEFAIQIEKNGEAFYLAVSKKTKSQEIKEAFIYLAQEEVRHRKIYEGLLKTVENYQPREIYPEEYFQYLRAYADQHIFVKNNEIEEKASKVKSDIEAIDIALGFEKDSILFYIEMRNFVPDNEKPIIDKIIEEEHRHYTKLTEVKKIIGEN
ncbi:MAG: ferritin-like domain-containing protein [Endomicrobiia bacterium]